MSWERDPLWAKARLFIGRAQATSHEDPLFGLWCSLGLELLARAAVASVSPTLLAEPDRDGSHRNLLYALARSLKSGPGVSLGGRRVFELCVKLFPEFTDEHNVACKALLSVRNEELHSGAAAFDAYPPNQWLAGFYRSCEVLCGAMGESLAGLLGDAEAAVAREMLAEDWQATIGKVQARIAHHRAVFAAKPAEEQARLREEAEKLGLTLAHTGHHRVPCPACEAVATVRGSPVSSERADDEDGAIVVRQDMAARSFSCSACELKLEGYAEVAAANVDAYFTHTTTYSPAQYYGLIEPDEIPSYVDEYLKDLGQEYDNE
jgi:hypothetical protein